MRKRQHFLSGRHGSVFICSALLVATFFPIHCAAAQATPALQKRGADNNSPAAQPAPELPGFSSLPASASGEYELDDKGSVVQITIENNRLTGYVTKMEQETALTLDFDKSSIHGTRVSFTTKTVHGLHYSFEGEIVRGDAISEGLTGFYRMTGNWTTYRAGYPQTEHISLKSTPRD